jgi:hypothetical protein
MRFAAGCRVRRGRPGPTEIVKPQGGGVRPYKPKAVRPRARSRGCRVCSGRVPRLTALGFYGQCITICTSRRP